MLIFSFHSSKTRHGKTLCNVKTRADAVLQKHQQHIFLALPILMWAFFSCWELTYARTRTHQRTHKKTRTLKHKHAHTNIPATNQIENCSTHFEQLPGHSDLGFIYTLSGKQQSIILFSWSRLIWLSVLLVSWQNGYVFALVIAFRSQCVCVRVCVFICVCVFMCVCVC